jgi:glycosyltransferase involved in cell wall biosynthesis
MLYLVLTKYRKADLLIVTNPPFSVFIPLFAKNTFDLLIYDLYPDALEEYHYLSSRSPIYKLWCKANRQVFKRARKIITLSDGMKEKIAKYAAERPIEVIPIWTDNDFLKPIPKDQNPFVEQWGLQGKFVVMYSGNLGKTHPVEVLFELAKAFEGQEGIVFLIIGGGHKYQKLKTLIEGAGLSNICLLEWQPVESIPYTLAVADVGVVTLDAHVANLSVPSKTYDLMAIGVPILAIASPESELSGLLARHDAGACFAPEDLVSIQRFILELYNDKTRYTRLAGNSLKAAGAYTAKNAEAFL